MVENLPKISVIMPVFNCDTYLEDSIHSILNQTFKDFEFIIVCSCPTNKTKEILEKYQSLDSRILIFYQERKGIIFARNFGCQRAIGEFVAVMDADDIACPKRFETQLSFMEKHPDIGIVGSWGDIIDENGVVTDTIRGPTNPYVIGWYLLFGNCMMNLTILMRTNILKDLHYYTHEENGFPEDYDLFCRAFFITKIANIPVSLAQYRIHSTNNSVTVKSELDLFCNKIRNTMVQQVSDEKYLAFLEETELQRDSDIFAFNIEYNDKQIRHIENLYNAYIHHFDITGEDLMQIRSHLALKMLMYSHSMNDYSKKKSIDLLCKAVSYSKSTVIKTIICAFGRRLRHLVNPQKTI